MSPEIASPSFHERLEQSMFSIFYHNLRTLSALKACCLFVGGEGGEMEVLVFLRDFIYYRV